MPDLTFMNDVRVVMRCIRGQLHEPLLLPKGKGESPILLSENEESVWAILTAPLGMELHTISIAMVFRVCLSFMPL